MSPAHVILTRGRVVLDASLYVTWKLEGRTSSYPGQFDARHETLLLVGGIGPEASATLVVSAPTVEASGITTGSRVVVMGRTYVVTGYEPQPQAFTYHLADPET